LIFSRVICVQRCGRQQGIFSLRSRLGQFATQLAIAEPCDAARRESVHHNLCLSWGTWNINLRFACCYRRGPLSLSVLPILSELLLLSSYLCDPTVSPQLFYCSTLHTCDNQKTKLIDIKFTVAALVSTSVYCCEEGRFSNHYAANSRHNLGPVYNFCTTHTVQHFCSILNSLVFNWLVVQVDDCIQPACFTKDLSVVIIARDSRFSPSM
jgi:hypothetical protein